jgi:hypothetical protein
LTIIKVKEAISANKIDTNNDLISGYKETLPIISQDNSNEVLKNLTPIYGEVWIGKKDYNLYKIATSYEFSSGIDNSVAYDLRLQFKNYDKPIQIDIPEKTYSPQDLLS